MQHHVKASVKYNFIGFHGGVGLKFVAIFFFFFHDTIYNTIGDMPCICYTTILSLHHSRQSRGGIIDLPDSEYTYFLLRSEK